MTDSIQVVNGRKNGISMRYLCLVTKRYYGYMLFLIQNFDIKYNLEVKLIEFFYLFIKGFSYGAQILFWLETNNNIWLDRKF